MSDGPLSPEEVAHRGFPTAFRGFDTNEVRAYLARVANELRATAGTERELHRRLADAEHRAAHPVIEGEALTRALGEEMGRILASAQEAATDLKARAEENAARILREAHDQAQRIRAQAEVILADRSEEADAQAAEIRRAAAVEAAAVADRARREAAEATAEVEARARQVVHEAQAARARVLGDLTRRRRLLQMQVEQLRAGRERLLEAYRLVRRSIDEVADELQRAEGEARDSAMAAGDRVAADAEPGAEDLDDVLAAFPAPAPAPAPATATARPGGPDAEGADAAGGAESPNPDLAVVEELLTSEVGGAEPGTAAGGEVHHGAASPGAEHPSAEGSPAKAPEGHRSGLRLLRRQRGDAHLRLEVAESPSDAEGVRVIATRPGGPGTRAAPPATPVASPAAAVPSESEAGAGPSASEAEPVPSESKGEPGQVEVVEPEVTPSSDRAGAPAARDDRPAGEPAPGPAVEELFARIRAGRADAVAKAHEVLGAEGPGVAPAEPATSTQPPPEATSSAAAREEALLQRRDHAVEGLEARLARKLKRALQDEQNEVLDRLRSAGPGAGADVVLSPAEGQAARYAEAAGELLRASAAAGSAFAEPGADARPRLDDLVGELTASLADPLRRALERALGGASGGGDQSAVMERIGAVYRECKAQRIEGLAGDAVTAAFSRGALAALPPGTSSQWVVDDDGRPCPDCDDNALAGPTPPGEAFPTGQAHPPAHAGCRCLLAPAEVAAVANGTG